MDLNAPHRIPPKHLLIVSMVAFVLALLCFAVLVGAEEHRSATKFTATSTALASLAVVDGAQTTTCVKAGRCLEANPLYRPVAGSYAGMAAMKTAATAGVIAGAWQLRKRHPRAAWTLLGVATAAQGFAVAWNARQLHR